MKNTPQTTLRIHIPNPLYTKLRRTAGQQRLTLKAFIHREILRAVVESERLANAAPRG